MTGSRGFTLIELVVTIAIAAIVAAFALPMLQSSIAAKSSQSIASNLAQDLQWARMQATSGAGPVSVQINPDCSWQISLGSPLTADSAHSQSVAQISQIAPGGATCQGVPAGGVVLSYQSNGLVSGGSDLPVTISTVSGGRASLRIFASGVVMLGASDAQ